MPDLMQQVWCGAQEAALLSSQGTLARKPRRASSHAPGLLARGLLSPNQELAFGFLGLD